MLNYQCKNFALLFFVCFWHMEKYSLSATHCSPGAHLVMPVQVFPPHCSYS